MDTEIGCFIQPEVVMQRRDLAESSRSRRLSLSGNAGYQQIERLRREVNKLKAEPDILEKAAACFAKEAT
jgi:transposase-like protein